MYPTGRRRHRDEPPPAGALVRAEEALARARRRNCWVVTGEMACSPADCTQTVVIPRHVVTAADPRHADPDATQVIAVHWAASPAGSGQPTASR